MHTQPKCPKCNSEYTYEDGAYFICPECTHEWTQEDITESTDSNVIRDAHGSVLQNGDTIKPCFRMVLINPRMRAK